MTSHCLEILRHRASVLHALYVQAERLAHEDPASTCVKLRAFAEEVAAEVLVRAGRARPKNLADALERLARDAAAPAEILTKLHELRTIGNRGAHARGAAPPTTAQAMIALAAAHAVGGWLATTHLGVPPAELVRFQPPPPDASFSLFRDAVMTDDAQAQYQVGLAVLHQAEARLAEDLRQSPVAFIDGFRDAARWFREVLFEVPGARSQLGRLLERGLVKPASEGERLYWLERAADDGDADGHAQLGVAYLEGKEGLQVDVEKALDHLEAAANGDHLDALNRLAAMFADGDRVDRDPVRALGYARRAAEAGYPLAQHNLAVLLLRGQHGEPPDPTAAFGWFERAAEGGSADSMMALATCFRDGQGTAVDLESWRRWRQRAAEAGSAGGLIAMGEAHELGDGVRQSPVEALHFYSRVAAIGECVARPERVNHARERSRALVLRIRQDFAERRGYPVEEFDDRFLAVVSSDEHGDLIPDASRKLTREMIDRGLGTNPDAFFDAIAEVNPYAARFFGPVLDDVRMAMRAPTGAGVARSDPLRRKAGPNDRCPCGSGKKQKKCHPGRRR